VSTAESQIGTLRAPFPWFGGKSRAADIVWRAFGNVPNYVEPFAGSLAVLLSRPHEPKIETVNDVDSHLANFWRAVSAAPDDVAQWCDWPVSEPDLHARHRWLVATLQEHRARMVQDPEYFDAKRAGWWVWGLSMWIGSGWCTASTRHGGDDVHEKRPDVSASNAGHGVHAVNADWSVKPHTKRRFGRRTNARNGGHGVSSAGQPPSLSGGGRGINAPSRMPDLMGNQGVVNGLREGRWAEGAPVTRDGPPALEWFRALQARLRRVRVCCGDWTRVRTPSVLGTTRSRNSGMNPCAVFLDPPYGGDERAAGLYAEDDTTLAARVAAWARENGDDKDLRIALCGYEGEHDMPGWTCHAWKATRGYSGDDNDNCRRERIWFSPHCLPIEDAQRALF